MAHQFKVKLSMHDWTLLDMRVDWGSSEVELGVLDGSSSHRSIVFKGLRELSVDRREHWGPSRSVNEAAWISAGSEDGISMKLEMQTGGIISISAVSCEVDGMPHTRVFRE